VKVKLDENMPADLATRLRAAGHDVMDVAGEGLGGEDDLPVLQAATKEGRILLTFDLDFADIRHYPPGSHAGIVVFRLQDQRWRSLQGPVDRLLAGNILDGLGKGLAIVDETRVRYKHVKKGRFLMRSSSAADVNEYNRLWLSSWHERTARQVAAFQLLRAPTEDPTVNIVRNN
jgi:predicted nuclease of predicted toxin-antitoxin system